jgi:hypothetical protein
MPPLSALPTEKAVGPIYVLSLHERGLHGDNERRTHEVAAMDPWKRLAEGLQDLRWGSRKRAHGCVAVGAWQRVHMG